MTAGCFPIYTYLQIILIQDTSFQIILYQDLFFYQKKLNIILRNLEQ